MDIPVIAYDPMAVDSAKKATRSPIRFVDSAQDCIQDAEVVVLATPWNEFKHLDFKEGRIKPPQVIIDCWRMLEPEKLNKQINYIAVGLGPPAGEEKKSG